MYWLDRPPRFLFFTGKGGVGKTSIACASALRLAEQGRRVLLVSTDPASNVAQVFGVEIGCRITEVLPGLDALEISPEQAAAAFRERIVAPVRDLLPAAEIAAITEQLSGSCTTEVASFNEFTELLTDDRPEYDHIVFDTAPTGHTVRLLQLPGSWTTFLDDGKGDASCLGPLAGLDKRREQYAAALAALGDPALTRLVLVTRAQTSALAEVARTYSELAAIGISATNLVVNAVMPETGTSDDVLVSAEREVLARMPAAISGLPRDEVPLRAHNIVGLAALRGLFAGGDPAGDQGFDALDARGLGDLVDEIEADGRGLVLCMGKGGVGKTTVAAAIAVALAARGHDVHLTTTDPAAHLTTALPTELPNLQVTRIDPVFATEQYRQRVMTTKGRNLDDEGRVHLAEDLRSPCTEEIAVFQQFSRVVLEGRRRFVVVDTAPTGHTVLLLDSAGAHHREMLRQAGGEKIAFHTPLMLLRDPRLTKVVVVTTAEPTPVTEAIALQEDLQRAGITPWAWVVNASLAAARPQSTVLRARAAAEVAQFRRIEAVAPRLAAVAMLAGELTGERALLALRGSSLGV